MVFHCLKSKVLAWNIVPFLLPLHSYILSLPCCSLCSNNRNYFYFPVHAVLLEHAFVQDILSKHSVLSILSLFSSRIQLRCNFQQEDFSEFPEWTTFLFTPITLCEYFQWNMYQSIPKYSRVWDTGGEGRHSHHIHYWHPVNYQTECKWCLLNWTKIRCKWCRPNLLPQWKLTTLWCWIDSFISWTGYDSVASYWMVL